MPQRVQTPLDELTYKIIGCALEVHRGLGRGYREDTYQRGLELALSRSNLSHHPQKLLEVYDPQRGTRLLGYYIPDFIVAEQIIVEIKALREIDNNHVGQVIGYLAVSRLPVGLLINFGSWRLEWRRIFPPAEGAPHQVNRRWLFVPNELSSAER